MAEFHLDPARIRFRNMLLGKTGFQVAQDIPSSLVSRRHLKEARNAVGLVYDELGSPLRQACGHVLHRCFDLLEIKPIPGQRIAVLPAQGLSLLVPNDTAQQPGGRTERHVSKNRNGRPVCCSELFGAKAT
jgi:hypothetical protein